MQQLKHLLKALILIITVCAEAQVGIGTATPAATAQLDVSSTTSPRLVAHEPLVQFFIKFNNEIFKMNSPIAMLSCATNAGG